jgi:hypothetical protein
MTLLASNGLRRAVLVGASLLTASCILPKLSKVDDAGAGGEKAENPAAAGVGGQAAAGAAGAGNSVLNGSPRLLQQYAIDKLDLLLMIDNSLGMADKQRLLNEAVTKLLVRAATEAPAFNDIHVGVITSSLGSHGSPDAHDICATLGDDDHAHLLGEVRDLKFTTWNHSGFLAWDPRGRLSPVGESKLPLLTDAAAAMIDEVGEQGCGFEASLEAWYRFLVDPEPPSQIVVEGNLSHPSGVDQALLDQRAAFLRPDSALAIVMVSDENDCSIVDQGYGWLVSHVAPMYRSTSQCALNANDPCCQSCAEQTANAGCPTLTSDSECTKGSALSLADEDALNLRCWDQKRRFGLDLLYPVTRYVDALVSPTVPRASDNQLVQNPLFAHPAGMAGRDPRAISLMGVLGVPWQDLADDGSLKGAGLHYLTASELEARGRWKVIAGDPSVSPPRAPRDPFMVETPADRTTLPRVPPSNPITFDALDAADEQNPRANAINGHEQVNVGNSDLQYACIFPLAEPRVCNEAAFEAGQGCDCFQDDVVFNRPLCQSPVGGAPAGTTQYYAKAYPGIRELEVLRGIGERAVVTSICPKVLDPHAADYGYDPAMDALLARVHDSAAGCLATALPSNADGTVPCRVYSVSLRNVGGCDCGSAAEVELGEDKTQQVLSELESKGVCGDSVGTTCGTLCTCEVPQLSGDALDSCQHDPRLAANLTGFCYLNAMSNEPNVGSAELIDGCPENDKRLLRFAGDFAPLGTYQLLSCEP